MDMVKRTEKETDYSSQGIFQKYPAALFFLFFTFYLFCFISCKKGPPPQKKPVAGQGVIDFRNWSFEKDGLVSIKGEWKYIHMADNPDFADPGYDDSAWNTLSVPGPRISTVGYGWLRLKMKISREQQLALLIPQSTSSYTCYINGTEYISVGKPATDQKDYVPGYQRVYLNFFPDDEVTIALRVSNFIYFWKTSPVKVIIIGPPARIQLHVMRIDLTIYTISGILLMMAIYHLLLWFRRVNEVVYLYFSLFCLVTFVYSIISVLDNQLSFTATLQIILFLFPCSWVSLSAYFYTLFPGEYKKPVFYLFIGVSAAALFYLLFFPVTVFSGTASVLLILTLSQFTWAILSVIRASLKNKKEAHILLGGILFFFLTVVLDSLFISNLIPFLPLILIGFMGFVFAHAVMLSTHFIKAVREQEHLKNEMGIAQKIQTIMLPSPPEHAEIEIEAFMKPAYDVGGDYYDIMTDCENNLWFAIGDVSGHGLTPGLLMMMAQSFFSASIKNTSNPSPKEAINSINTLMYENINNRLKTPHFMTLTLLKYTNRGTFLFAGAHVDLIIYRKKSRRCQIIPTVGTFIGFIPDISQATENNSFSLEKGDILLLYTDGITEARNKDTRKLMGEKRLMVILENHAHEELAVIKTAIISTTLKWSGSLLSDDLTLILVKRKE